MDSPVDYGEVSKYLKESRGIESIPVKTEYHSTWLDNSKAKFLLDWQPNIGLKKLIDLSWDYQREVNDPRKIWYPVKYEIHNKLITGLYFFLSSSLADWPQFLGSNRNGNNVNESVPLTFKNDEPTFAWTRDVGFGLQGQYRLIK